MQFVMETGVRPCGEKPLRVVLLLQSCLGRSPNGFVFLLDLTWAKVVVARLGEMNNTMFWT